MLLPVSYSVNIIFFILLILSTNALVAEDPPRPPSLKTVTVSEPDNLAEFIIDKHRAIELGKALFWEMRVGSDGVTACGTCHFNAGSDSRSKNQINPGSNQITITGSPDPDLIFDFPPNHQLTMSDFPFRKLNNPLDRNSYPDFDSNDIVSSQGVNAAQFSYVKKGKARDIVSPKLDQDGFLIDNENVRRVASRHAPSVINAVFNFRNLNNGSAQNEFNGVNKWGDRDPTAKVFKAKFPFGKLEPISIRIKHSSLASLAVGPPVSDREMSATGRTFPDIGRKLLSMRPLELQRVHPQDSVLGQYSRWPKAGLDIRSYQAMIKAAFHPQWWSSNKKIRVSGKKSSVVPDENQSHNDDYDLMEYNFSLYFGLAIQAYLATLIADDTPYDRFMMGETHAISEAAIRGVDLFRSQTRGRCINCHEGAELTGASITRISTSPIRVRDEQAFDRGFNNIGVRPTTDDISLGGLDPFGKPLSYTRKNPTTIPNCTNNLPCPVVADGFIKVPGLRNVELTAPYFHNGGTLTLQGVLDFYSRGGDYPNLEQLDGSTIVPLNILMNTEVEKADLEAFLRSLTDERVRYRKAPFDHPQLFIPVGYKTDSNSVENIKEIFLEIEAVGREGGKPLKQFLR